MDRSNNASNISWIEVAIKITYRRYKLHALEVQRILKQRILLRCTCWIEWNFSNGSTYRRLYKIMHCEKNIYGVVYVCVFLSYYLLLFELGTTLKKNMICCKYERVDLNYKIIQFSNLFFFLALVFITNLFAFRFRLSIFLLFHSFIRELNEFRLASFSNIYIFIWKRGNSLWIIALYVVCTKYMHLWIKSW